MVNYTGKLVLAPMVRSGELPTRLLALRYGADLVWSPEIVDKKIITCNRRFNPQLNTIEYLDPHGKVIFNTYKPLETGKLIFQMGSANPEVAVEAGLKVIDDVDGIDLNCGCPKNFSVHSGMGAALLSNSKLLCEILRNLVEKVGNPNNKPISCKIRLLNDEQESLDLIDKICQTGIKNLTLHCRTRQMRNREVPNHSLLPEIIRLVHSYNISFIINGNMMNKLDALNLKAKYGNQIGCMIAESAEANPTVFNLRPLPWNQAILEFVKICWKFNNHPSNTKYILLNQLPSKSKYYQMFSKLKSNEEMLNLAQSIQFDDDNVIGKLKFKFLQKDKIMTIDEYNAWKDIILNKTTETKLGIDLIPPINLKTDFPEVIPPVVAETAYSLKRKLELDESPNKVIKT